jgi:hypothetical protein
MRVIMTIEERITQSKRYILELPKGMTEGDFDELCNSVEKTCDFTNHAMEHMVFGHKIKILDIEEGCEDGEVEITEIETTELDEFVVD